ncbi:Por secretion system C-terminal sorting domain-containing protein [Lishizhenia tianjinensis]|uniref:Por secretion system C-terminal sorting domain-containing protein n=1 Tax=Lishizhenia tianjinensis TaxID=477690 RepID=A0A1I7AFR2_9FLAO|nr:T9SS type A sorting domain-containing protein [Lishizhenia tianjinensis]SFT73789.1 Por secretion system C-terminal sorting domain-containing protein [Lishizhenia tianjinensis]
MKKISLLLMGLLLTSLSIAQTNVGSGTSTGQAIPIEPYYGYTYSQSIYLSSEISASGSITGVRYYTASGTSLDANSYDWVVSIATSTKTSFSGVSDWEPVSNFTQVYADSAYVVSDPAGDYVEILFDSPFAYNGTDNIIMAVAENQTGFGANSDEFLCSSTTNDRALTYYDDYDAQDMTSLFDANTTRAYIPNITFLGITPACTPVDGVDLNSVTSDGFDIIIDHALTAPSYEVEFGLSGFTQGSGNTTIITGDSLNLDTLMSNTTYDIYVRSVCSTTDTSTVFGPASVTTECVTYIPDHTEDFSNYLPECWVEASGALTTNSSLSFGSSDWGSSSGSAKVNIYSTSKDEWLISPSFDLSAGNNFLSFNIRATEYFSSADAIWGADDSMAVVISTDNGATWSTANILELFNVNNNPGATAQVKSYDLSAYTGTVKFAFYAASTVSNEDIDVYVDDFFVGQQPSCLVPTSLTVGTVTNNSVDLAWTTYYGTGTDFQVGIVEAGQAFSTATLSLETGNSTTISGLMSNTDYEVYIRQICGAGDTSGWTTVAQEFTTACDAVGLGYTEDFANYLPSCWGEADGLLGSNVTLNGGSSSWTNDDYGNQSAGSESARINIYSDNVEEWLISPSIDLTGGNTQVSFDMIATEWGSTSSAVWGSDDSLAIVVSTDNGATWSNANIEKVFTATNPIAAAGETVTINLTDYTSFSAVRIGFYAKSDASNEDIDVFVDNFVVELVPDVTPSLVQVPTIYCGTGAINADFYLVNNSLTNAADVDYEVFVDGVSLATGVENIPADDSVLVTVGPLTPTVGAHDVNVVTSLNGDADGTNDSETITVYVSAPDVSATVTDILCNGDMNGEIALSTVDAIGNVDYSWSSNANGAITPTITGLGAGVYMGYVVDSIGCQDSIEINLVEPALIEVSLDSIFDVLCYGGSTGELYVTATGGTAPLDFLWDNGETTEDNTVGVMAGDYALTVTDANGCTFTTPDYTVAEPTELVATATDNLNGTATANVTGGTPPYEYVWDNGDQTQTQTTVQLGVQTVVVTDDNGCETTASVTTVVGLDDVNPLNAVRVYPNPTIHILNIDITELNNVAVDIALYDNTGRLVHQLSGAQNQVVQFNTSELARGLYTLKLQNGKTLKTVKIVVQ